MSTDNNDGNGLWIVALSALAGFAAVYVTLGQRDNAAQPPVAIENTVKTAPAAKVESKTEAKEAKPEKKKPRKPAEGSESAGE